MPGWKKYLAQKYKDQDLDPQSPCKSWTGSAAACPPNTHEAETGYPQTRLANQTSPISEIWVQLEALLQ